MGALMSNAGGASPGLGGLGSSLGSAGSSLFNGGSAMASTGGGLLGKLFQQQPGLLMQQGGQLAGMAPNMISPNQSSTGGPLSQQQMGSLVQPSLANRGAQAGGQLGQGMSQPGKPRGVQDIGMGLQALQMLALLGAF